MTDQQMLEMFQQQNPDVKVDTPAGVAAFRLFQQQQGGGTNPFSPTGTNTPVSGPANNNPSLNNAIDAGLLGGADAALSGGNTRQVQGGNQEGSFNSAGSSAQVGTTAQNTVGSTQQQQQSNSNTTGTSTGLTGSAGTSTTGVNDTLGFGQLLKGQAGSAGAVDSSRNAYLTDLMQNGGDAFQTQVAQATNKALSGPGMQGVGIGAQGRAVGDAVGTVAMNNEGQRLQAAQQLAGPTATQTLASSGTPFLGSTTSNANIGTTQQSQQQQNNTSSNTSGTTSENTTGLSSLLNSQASSGNSQAGNRQVAYGDTPQQSTSGGGGGSVVCTALGERGLLPRWMLEDELVYVRRNWRRYRHAAKGYYSWGVPLARLVRKSNFVAKLCLPFAKACAYEAARRASVLPLPEFLWPKVAFYCFLIPNTFLGYCLPGEARIRDAMLNKMLFEQNLQLGTL